MPHERVGFGSFRIKTVLCFNSTHTFRPSVNPKVSTEQRARAGPRARYGASPPLIRHLAVAVFRAPIVACYAHYLPLPRSPPLLLTWRHPASRARPIPPSFSLVLVVPAVMLLAVALVVALPGASAHAMQIITQFASDLTCARIRSIRSTRARTTFRAL